MKVSRILINQIQGHLDALVVLGRDCKGGELPLEQRTRAKYILDNIFDTKSIKDVSCATADLKKKIQELEEVLRTEEDVNAMLALIRLYQKSKNSTEPIVLKRSWLGDLINSCFGKSIKITRPQEIKFGSEVVTLNPAPSFAERGATQTETFYAGKELKNIPSRMQKKPRSSRVPVESFSIAEINSQFEERRLDGSPNPFENRDAGKFGSFPSFDDYSEEAHA